MRIQAEGRIGAEKIFNTLLKLDKGGLSEALKRGYTVIERRTRYVRAMNVILATPKNIHVASVYNEDAEYFDMRISKNSDRLVICSESYPEVDDWASFGNSRFESFPC